MAEHLHTVRITGTAEHPTLDATWLAHRAALLIERRWDQ